MKFIVTIPESDVQFTGLKLKIDSPLKQRISDNDLCLAPINSNQFASEHLFFEPSSSILEYFYIATDINGKTVYETGKHVLPTSSLNTQDYIIDTWNQCAQKSEILDLRRQEDERIRRLNNKDTARMILMGIMAGILALACSAAVYFLVCGLTVNYLTGLLIKNPAVLLYVRLFVNILLIGILDELINGQDKFTAWVYGTGAVGLFGLPVIIAVIGALNRSFITFLETILLSPVTMVAVAIVLAILLIITFVRFFFYTL